MEPIDFDFEKKEEEKPSSEPDVEKPIPPSDPERDDFFAPDGAEPKPELEPEPEDEPEPEPKKKKEKPKKKLEEGEYTARQKNTAMVLYVSIVIATIITLVGVVWAIADIFAISGKLDAFLALSLGYQMAIVGGFAAGFFFILIFFLGLARKGIRVILKITFKPREIEEKYQNKTIVKIMAGALMISIFVIIIGIILSLILEALLGSEQAFSITTIFQSFDSTGPFVLFLGIFLLIMNALAFSLNWLWYNGYYFLLRLVTDLEKVE